MTAADPKSYSPETWHALIEVDPVGTFEKLSTTLNIPGSTADIILADHNGDHRAACRYLLAKLKGSPPPARPPSSVPVLSLIIIVGIIVLFFLVTITSSIEILGGVAVFFVAAFFLYHSYVTGAFRPTFRAGCYLWLILFASLSFVITEASEGIAAAFAPTAIPTRKPYPTLTPRVVSSGPSSSCLHWSQVTPQMAGRTLCVYGAVHSLYATDEASTRIKFTDQPNTFFIFSAPYTFTDEHTGAPLSVGDCIQITSPVKLFNNIPYMDIGEEILYNCN